MDFVIKPRLVTTQYLINKNCARIAANSPCAVAPCDWILQASAQLKASRFERLRAEMWLVAQSLLVDHARTVAIVGEEKSLADCYAGGDPLH